MSLRPISSHRPSSSLPPTFVLPPPSVCWHLIVSSAETTRIAPGRTLGRADPRSSRLSFIPRRARAAGCFVQSDALEDLPAPEPGALGGAAGAAAAANKSLVTFPCFFIEQKCGVSAYADPWRLEAASRIINENPGEKIRGGKNPLC